MYRTKTNVFVHRTLLVLFFPSLFCQKTGFCCRVLKWQRIIIYTITKKLSRVQTAIFIFFLIFNQIKKNVLPWELSAGYGLSNFFPVKIMRFASQILWFFLWHPPKILRNSLKPFPTPYQSFFSIFFKNQKQFLQLGTELAIYVVKQIVQEAKLWTNLV